jgi:hypothetical protein
MSVRSNNLSEAKAFSRLTAKAVTTNQDSTNGDSAADLVHEKSAEILAWIVALQMLYPGTLLLYDSVSAVLDMRTGLRRLMPGISRHDLFES